MTSQHLNQYEVMSTLCKHRVLTLELIKIQTGDDLGFSSRNIKKLVSSHIQNLKIKSTNPDTFSNDANLVRSAFSLDNLLANSLLNEIESSKYSLVDEVVSLFDLLSSNGDLYDKTLSNSEMDNYVHSLDLLYEKMQSYEVLPLYEKEDLLKDIKKKMQSLVNDVRRTSRILKDEVDNFGKRLTNNDQGLQTLKERNEEAVKLMASRIKPFQSFLLYADKDNGRVSNIIIRFSTSLQSIGEYGLANLLESYIFEIKKFCDLITTEKGELSNLIKSSAELLKTIQMTDYYTETFFTQFDELLDGKKFNRNIYDCEIIENLTFFENGLSSVFAINCKENTSNFCNNLEELEEELFDINSIKSNAPTISNEELKIILQESKNAATIKIKSNTVRKIIEEYIHSLKKNNDIKELFLSGEEFDLFSIIITDLKDLLSIYKPAHTYNFINGIASNLLRYYKQTYKIRIKSVSLKNDYNSKIRYPILKTILTNKEI
nr:hypothetical protein [Moritella viscosa]SHO15524.1 Putative uncharacterized protein [Moritella viscosa]